MSLVKVSKPCRKLCFSISFRNRWRDGPALNSRGDGQEPEEEPEEAEEAEEAEEEHGAQHDEQSPHSPEKHGGELEIIVVL